MTRIAPSALGRLLEAQAVLCLANKRTRAYDVSMAGAAPGQQASVEVARRGLMPVGRVPATRYARSGDHNIAYSVSGSGPIDLVVVSGLVSQIEHVWEEPSLARFLAKLGGFCRIVLFDPWGVGLSDALVAGGVPSLEERVADIAAVMDAVGIDRAAILGFSNGGPPAMAMAAEHPDQVFALILVATTSRTPLPPAYPTARSFEEFGAMLGVWAQHWGTGAGLEDLAPSASEDARMRKWWAKCQRLTGGPGTIVASLQLLLDLDMSDTLATITAPTLVMHAEDDQLIPVAAACEIAEGIPGAQLALSAGADHMFWLGDQNDRLDTIRGFLAELPEGRDVPALPTRPSRPPSGWESLTPAELDVAWLVAQGFTNPDIGRRLYVSPRTVQTHLKHIFWKLNAASRSEVAAEAARRLAAA